MRKKVVSLPPFINLVLEWFEKEGDALIGEELILKFTAQKAHSILGVTDKRDYFICNAYPLNIEKASLFQKYVTHTIDLEKYEYFIVGVRDEDIELYNLH